MKFIIAIAAALPVCLGAPSSGAQAIGKRHTTSSKFNQYATKEDCGNDDNILFHASPPTMTCYDLDDSTGSYFIDTGILTGVDAFNEFGCEGEVVNTIEGECLEKGEVKSIRMW